jgi:hypothetical protein
MYDLTELQKSCVDSSCIMHQRAESRADQVTLGIASTIIASLRRIRRSTRDDRLLSFGLYLRTPIQSCQETQSCSSNVDRSRLGPRVSICAIRAEPLLVRHEYRATAKPSENEGIG